MRLAEFVPGHYAAVSRFAAAEGGGEIALRVRPDLLAYAVETGNAVKAACFKDGVVEYVTPVHVDRHNGVIVVRAEAGCNYTIVVEGLCHQLPVVTHWDAELNGGRGGFRQGATDGIGWIRLFDPFLEEKWSAYMMRNAIGWGLTQF